MAFLLDTNVVSELRRPRPHGAVLAWLESTNDMDLHLASVTLGEIQAGIEQAVLMCPCSIRSNGALDLLEQQLSTCPVKLRACSDSACRRWPLSPSVVRPT